MLALPVQTRGGLLALEDDDSDRVYVALARPRVARRSDGSSRLRLVRWTTTDGGPSAVVGGRLTLDAEVNPTAQEIAAAGFASPGQVGPMPWLDASLRLEGPGFEPIDAAASVALGTASAVAVDLSPPAAALLAPLLQAQSVAPLQITWTGHVLVRLPPVEIIATADVTEVRRRLAMAHGDRQVIINKSVIDANARIEIRGAANAALEAALRDWVLDELAAQFAQGKSLSIRVAAADVVRWPIRLATTIDDVIPAAARHSLVETVLLDASAIGRAPAVEVRALGDFSGPLERVDVALEASAGNRSEAVSCTDDTPKRVGLGTLDFRWRHRVKIDGRAAGEWSSWTDVRGSSHLLVPVSVPATLRLEVLSVALDLTNRWASVRITITHDVPGSAPLTHVIELTAARPHQTWTTALDGVRGRVTAHAVFLSRQGQAVEQAIGEVAGDQIVVGDPLDNHRVRVSIVPAGTGWPEVSLVMVDLRYVDGAHVVDETVDLRRLDDFVEWEAPARPDGPRRIEWRRHACFTNGRFESSPWQSADAGVVVIRLEGTPRRDVQLLPIYFDAAVTPKATIRLRSGAQTETVAVVDRAARHVTLGPGPFTWTVAWTLTDGTEMPESQAENGDDVIVVPRFHGAQP